MYDLCGKKVKSLSNKKFTHNQHTFEINKQLYSKGIYLIKINTFIREENFEGWLNLRILRLRHGLTRNVTRTGEWKGAEDGGPKWPRANHG